MKFKPEAGDFPLDQDSCKADYTQARELGRVRLGQRALYFSQCPLLLPPHLDRGSPPGPGGAGLSAH